jgi:RNA recognition motif-containing protein
MNEDINRVKVFVGNLSYSATKEEIGDFFRQVGEVKGVNLRKDRTTGKMKGFGFVTFESEDHASEAISKFDGFNYDGRVLTVRPADKRGGGNTAPVVKEYVTSSSRDAKSEGKRSWTSWSGPPNP